MTQFVAFVPPPNNVFSFQPVLDGQTCRATTWWNTDAQRWYVTVTGPSGAALFNSPLIGSPYASPIESISWANGIVSATTSKPHGFRKFATMKLTVSGCGPEGYNGIVEAFVTGINSFTYPLANDPNDADMLGQVSYDINMGAGYLSSSMFLFREKNQMFEIVP
jgi:hypothetical protein